MYHEFHFPICVWFMELAACSYNVLDLPCIRVHDDIGKCCYYALPLYDFLADQANSRTEHKGNSDIRVPTDRLLLLFFPAGTSLFYRDVHLNQLLHLYK